MALTPEKREALTMARTHIETQRETYICLALDYVKNRHPRLQNACDSIADFIRDALDCYSLDIWQCYRGISRSPDQRGADRIAWIDWMLGDEL
ncbi:hypothetical protein [Burkholderia gladioli]|uniref:hypothetical protein n=1 Tax=Burkholderia gladioli TaxID=28095 RepID=UPI00163EF31D|nr:hypothetical protein [Burkholderia gladioli]